MSDALMLRGAEPRNILQTIIEQKTPAIMSYMSKGKWHVTKVYLTNPGTHLLGLEIAPSDQPNPVNVNVNQKIGVSIKYGYGKFIFDSIVAGFEASANPRSGGVIVVATPERIEFVQRRSYFRVRVPESMNVKAGLCRRHHKDDTSSISEKEAVGGKIIDISAGGLQIVFGEDVKVNFTEGQYVGVRFVPLPYEQPIEFNAQVRTVIPTADHRNVSVGLQIIGLEATDKGRRTLQRICSVVEYYYHVNQSGTKSLEMSACRGDQ